MKLGKKVKEILMKHNLIRKTLDFLDKRSDSVYKDYEQIEDCFSSPCEEEKEVLRNEMLSITNKLKTEEKELDRCEKNFHACSGEALQ